MTVVPSILVADLPVGNHGCQSASCKSACSFFTLASCSFCTLCALYCQYVSHFATRLSLRGGPGAVEAAVKGVRGAFRRALAILILGIYLFLISASLITIVILRPRMATPIVFCLFCIGASIPYIYFRVRVLILTVCLPYIYITVSIQSEKVFYLDDDIRFASAAKKKRKGSAGWFGTGMSYASELDERNKVHWKLILMHFPDSSCTSRIGPSILAERKRRKGRWVFY